MLAISVIHETEDCPRRTIISFNKIDCFFQFDGPRKVQVHCKPLYKSHHNIPPLDFCRDGGQVFT